MVIVGCDLEDGDSETSLTLKGEGAFNVFYATAKLHKAEVRTQTPDESSLFWESDKCRYTLDVFDDTYRLTVVPR